MKLTQKRLKELLDYDPETGVFVWRVYRSSNAKAGDIAGSLNKRGYMQISIDDKRYTAHRLVFLYVDGYFPENEVDHKYRDKLNNRRSDLREVSRRCNLRNKGLQKNNTSGVAGVCWDKSTNKWMVSISIPKQIHLGRFDYLIDAVEARWAAEVKYGFPNCNTTSSAYIYLQKQGKL